MAIMGSCRTSLAELTELQNACRSMTAAGLSGKRTMDAIRLMPSAPLASSCCNVSSQNMLLGCVARQPRLVRWFHCVQWQDEEGGGGSHTGAVEYEAEQKGCAGVGKAAVWDPPIVSCDSAWLRVGQDRWPNHMILRSSLIFGPQSPVPVSRALFLQFIERTLSAQKPAKFFSDEFR